MKLLSVLHRTGGRILSTRIATITWTLALTIGSASADVTMPVRDYTRHWVNANASMVNPQYMQVDTVTGNPSGQNSLLYWQTFDIPANGRVQFIQPSSTHIALNRITGEDHPSQILGDLDANGHVYLINPNGFLFGPGSRINVNRLVASSLELNMSNEDFLSGKNLSSLAVDQVETFNSQYDPADYDVIPATPGSITLKDGSVITTQDGGDVFILSPKIVDQGEINTSGGQTILAATDDKVYLTASSDGDLRGFLVEVHSHDLDISDETDPRIDVGDTGKISADHGNITLAALSIRHSGRLEATTSINDNGTIRLVARDNASFQAMNNASVNRELALGYTPDTAFTAADTKFALADTGGKVEVNGVISITPEVVTQTNSDGKAVEITAPDQQAQKPSRIEVTGREIRLQQHANLVSTGGEVLLHATEHPDTTAKDDQFNRLNTRDNSRVILESGSRIDVSGSNATLLPMERNQLEVQLSGDFLRDAPLQRDGALRNARVQVDIRDGTPLGDISDAVAGISKGVNERLSGGGTVNILSGGGVLTQDGSVIRTTGGSVTYKEGFVTTSRLVTSSQQVVDIGKANKNLGYTGLFGTVTKDGGRFGSGASRSWSLFGAGGVTRYYAGYTEGRDAGSVNIETYGAIIDGQVQAGTENGVYQRRSDGSAFADGGSLNLNLGIVYDAGNGVGTQDVAVVKQQRSIAEQLGEQDLHKSDEQYLEEYLTQSDDKVRWALGLEDDNLSNSGLSHLNIKTNGSFSQHQGSRFSLASGGSLDVTSGSIAVDGDMRIASGDVNLHNMVKNQTLRVSGNIDVSGNWVNDNPFMDSYDPAANVNLQGGSIRLSSIGDLDLTQTSSLKTNGGGWLKADGSLTVGNAGSIDVSVNNTSESASINLDGDMQGYAAGEGGTIKLTANRITIDDASLAPMTQTAPGELTLNSEFFNRGGFNNFELTANQSGLLVRSGTHIDPRVRSLQLRPMSTSLASTDSLLDVTTSRQLPAYERYASHLGLNANVTASNPNLVTGIEIESGASINLQPGSSLALQAFDETDLIMNGDLTVHGGQVNLYTEGKSKINDDYESNQAIWFNGNIDVSGSFVQGAHDDSLLTGTLYDGGEVNFDAEYGYIFTADATYDADGKAVTGVIDVRGAEATMDIPSQVVNNTVVSYQRRTLASNAGSIHYSAGEGMVLRSDMLANALDYPGASGGDISISMLKTTSSNAGNTASYVSKVPREIHLVQDLSNSDIPDIMNEGERINISDTNKLDTYAGKAWVAADSLQQAGFDNIELRTTEYQKPVTTFQPATIVMHGNLDLSAGKSLVLNTEVLQGDGGVINLQAPYVRLGYDQETSAVLGAPEQGNGILNVRASGVNANGSRDGLLEIVGDLSTSGIGETNFSSDGGIRFRGVSDDSTGFYGSLAAWGSLNLTADQVYATSLSNIDVSLYSDTSYADLNHDGINDYLLGIHGTGDQGHAVLSAASRMQFSAPVIEQAGIVKAPQGQIAFNASERLTLAPGSVTSVSGEGQLVPLGMTKGETSWVYPLSLVTINDLQLTPSAKRVDLNSDDVEFMQGASVLLDGGVRDSRGHLQASDDLYAYEFIPGLGGSVDALDSANTRGAFAVIPGAGSYSPYDYVYWEGQNNNLGNIRMGQQIYLSGSDLLADGLYTIMPARYALLPGARLVTPLSDSSGRITPDNVLLPGQVQARLDGTNRVAGQYRSSATGFADSTWSAFAVESDTSVRQRAEYLDSYAGQFFRDQAVARDTLLPDMPQDAGQLNLNPGSRLVLEGDISGDVGQVQRPQLDGSVTYDAGRGSQVNIAGDDIHVVNTRGDSTGGIELLAANLNKLNVSSLLLGGSRSRDADGVHIQVSATDVTLEQDAQLALSDLYLVAKDAVAVKQGAGITAVGDSNLQDSVVYVDGHGALLRVSAADQVVINRNASGTPTSGSLALDKGSDLTASGSMLLDASVDTRLDGGITFVDSDGNVPQQKTGSLNLSAERISIGTDTAPVGVTFSADALQNFDVADLVLTSRSSVDFYGNLDLAFDGLDIRASSLDGYQQAGQHLSITANRFTMGNPADETLPGSLPTGAGDVNISADTIRLKQGDFMVRGFNQVRLNASREIIADRDAGSVTDAGTTAFDISGDLALNAARITTASNVSQTIRTNAASNTLLSIGYIEPSSELADSSGLGGHLSILSDRIRQQGVIEMHSGSVRMQTTGTDMGDDLVLDSGSVINVSGIQRDFAGNAVFTDGGSVNLVSDHGNVQVSGAKVDQPAAAINLSGGIDGQGMGADAGNLVIASTEGTSTLNGQLLADHGDSARAGSFDLDTAGLGDFVQLNTLLNQSGMTQRRHVRLRNGNLTLTDFNPDGAEVVAHDVNFSADQGSVTLQGQIDASGDKGGKVSLSAATDLGMQSGSAITAAGKSGEGGSVFMEICSNAADPGSCGGSMTLAGSIDVSGAGLDGKIHIRTPRNNTNDGLLLSDLTGDFTGFRRFDIEGYKRYTSLASLDTALSDNASFMSNNVLAGFGLDSKFDAATLLNVHLRPGDDMVSAAAISTSGNRDFLNQKYTNQLNGNAEAGILNLLAEGDVNINHNLDDGFVEQTLSLMGTITVDRLQSGESWSYGMVAGRDVSAAYSRQVIDGQGDINLATDTRVRTGTGDIDLAAGGRLSMATNARLYTAGTPTAVNPRGTLSQDISGFNSLDVLFLPGVEFPQGGGDVSIDVAGGIQANVQSFLVSDWLHRMGGRNLTRTPILQGHFAQLDDAGTHFVPTMVGISFVNFTQGIGALGGGDIKIESGGDINGLAVAIPTSIKPTTQFAQSGSGSNVVFSPLDSQGNPVVGNLRPEDLNYDVLGRGDLAIHANGSIGKSMFYTGNGELAVQATGDIGSAVQDQGVLLYAADSQVELQAGGNIYLQGITTPGLVPGSQYQKQQTDLASILFDVDNYADQAYFSSYSADAGLTLKAIGDISLVNQYLTAAGLTLFRNKSASTFTNSLQYFPGNLNVTSVNGSVLLGSIMTLMPSASGNLSILANNNVIFDNLDQDVSLFMPDSSEGAAPGLHNAASSLVDFSTNLKVTNVTQNTYIYPNQPLHLNDTEPVRVVANTGDIRSNNSNSSAAVNPEGADQLLFVLPKKAEFIAGRDILNLGLIGQNLHDQDVTLIQAGRDIRYSDSRTVAGTSGYFMGVWLGGPGELQVLAGRNIDLGDRGGINAEGNTRNPYLAKDNGADVLVMAGLGAKGADYQGFENYLFPSDVSVDNLDYANQLVQFTAGYSDQVTESTDFESALNVFRQLPEATQREFLSVAFFRELTQSTRRAVAEQSSNIDDLNALLAETGNAGRLNTPEADSINDLLGYSRGLDAISSLFPGTIGSVTPTSLHQDNNPDTLITAGESYQIPPLNPAYRGNITLTSSLIESQSNGSDILVMAPGGGMDVGLAISTGSASSRGIIARGDGNIGVFTHNDVAVNESRIQALVGGDIVIWSTKGNVDAGRGATTLLNVPAPRSVLNPATGEFEQVIDATVQGSGIRATSSGSSVELPEKGFNINIPGKSTVVLAAPEGVIDAGDAGIKTEGNASFGTETIVNGDQIDVGGTAVGGIAADTPMPSVPSVDPNQSTTDQQSELVAQDASDQFGAGSIAILRVQVESLDEDSNTSPSTLPDNSSQSKGQSQDKDRNKG